VNSQLNGEIGWNLLQECRSPRTSQRVWANDARGYLACNALTVRSDRACQHQSIDEFLEPPWEFVSDFLFMAWDKMGEGRSGPTIKGNLRQIPRCCSRNSMLGTLDQTKLSVT